MAETAAPPAPQTRATPPDAEPAHTAGGVAPRTGSTLAPRNPGAADPAPGFFRRLGPLGGHARRAGLWFSAGPWVLLVAMLNFLLLMARQQPCRQALANHPINTYYRLCYSDISILYQAYDLYNGRSAYSLEYPVLTGVIIDAARSLAHLFGASLGPDTIPQEVVDGANLFFAVTAVLLFLCFLVAVLAQMDTVRTRPFDAMMVAGAPVVFAAGLINWDLFCVALTALGFWLWSRKNPFLAGVFWGLGIAAKLYPFLLFIPLFALCLRSARLKAFAWSVLGVVVGWGVPNGVLAFVSMKDFLYFWTFNVDRGADLGSLWYALSLMGFGAPSLSTLVAALDIIGALAVFAIVILAPRRPRIGQVTFLMVAWFLIINKVYSPQYVLWLLPFVALARPRWRDWGIWTIGELAYFAAIWGHLAGTLMGPGQSLDRLYVAAVFLRIGVQLYLCAMVIWDIWHPRGDVVRARGADDPSGGVLDGAPDARWLQLPTADPDPEPAAA